MKGYGQKTMNSTTGSRKRELTEQVTDALIERIKTYKPGERIPSEMELAELEGVARGTIREAIKTLVSRNILEIKRGKGTFVADNPGVSDDPWGLNFVSDVNTAMTELMELRWMIEPNVAALAAERATEEDIAELERICKETEDKIRAGINHSQSDQQFHIAISKAAHNSIAAVVVRQMFTINHVDYLPDYLKNKLPDRLSQTITLHRQILDAIKAHDADKAQAAMVRHLEITMGKEAKG